MKAVSARNPFFLSQPLLKTLFEGKININIPTSMVGEQKMEGETQDNGSCTTGQCPTCKQAAEDAAQNEEISLAFLLALLPVITLTFFGQVGLL